MCEVKGRRERRLMWCMSRVVIVRVKSSYNEDEFFPQPEWDLMRVCFVPQTIC